jgi:hypothetical protein
MAQLDRLQVEPFFLFPSKKNHPLSDVLGLWSLLAKPKVGLPRDFCRHLVGGIFPIRDQRRRV